MQYFETKELEELEKAKDDLVRAFEKESRIIEFAAYAYLYKVVAVIGIIVLAVVFDHSILRFFVPVSAMMLIFITDSLLSAMKLHVWRDRHTKEKIYFDKSKAATDYSSERLLQFIATTDTGNALNENDLVETRVIN